MNIIELAKQAGLKVGTNIGGVTLFGSPAEIGLAHIDIDEMESFAALVRAEVLEEAADWFETEDNKHMFHSEMLWPHQVAERLRALKGKT